MKEVSNLSNPNWGADVTAGQIHGQSCIFFPLRYLFASLDRQFNSRPQSLLFRSLTQPPSRTPSMDRPTRPQAPGGREDCWSESATSTLITAWGERYVRMKRGNLRQKDWKDVAVVVNSSHNVGGKPFKTDVQCKNRIDTLKKKYKVEKSKPSPSTWPFYDRLHSLLGASTSDAAAVAPKTEPPILTLKGGSTESPIECDGDDGNCNGDGARTHAVERTEITELSGGAACRELARAILKFGEIYERIEKSKQEQMVEMEKQRMEFTKELELQRLNMLMEAQVELQKMKRPKYSSPNPASGKKL